MLNRRDHPESIFRDDGDPGLFVATLAEERSKADRQVHIFFLMSNRLRLAAETPRPNLVAGTGTISRP
jgi:hypothetical protein